MKVAYLFGSLNRGGTETLFLDVFRNADKSSFPFIGIHRKGGAYKDDFYAAGPMMIHCAPKRFGYIRYLLQLRQLLRTEGVAIAHAQHWLDGIYAKLATIGLPIRVALTLHGYFPQEGMIGRLCRMSIRMADEVCFVSRYEQEWYQQRMRIPDEKCHVIYNGIDIAKFNQENGRVRDLENEDKIRLCMVGNFVAVRDHITLFKALQLLHERDVNNFDFYFIGKRVEEQGGIYDTCEQIIKENDLTNVHFMGGRGDVPELLKSMDGFVYSTDHDTFGIAVVEAMAVGLPVVVNDYAVMKEVCGDMVTYYKSKDVGDCADAIEKLLAELPERKETAKKNAEVIRKRYSIEAYLARLNAVYGVKC